MATGEHLMRSTLFIISLVIGFSNEAPLAATGDSILSMEERAETVDRLVSVRLRDLPAKLMRREGLDMWVLIAREYNEDPVVMTMLPGTAHSARRRTILVFSDEGGDGVKGYAVSRYGVGDYFKARWNPE